ncbi:hypothetical protein CK203_015937 [Vitis vinifera]|uniref:Retrovirus-related Pol polyprotein from transposon TNT 1-94 n=1 Tax=Vitis vinifera TaxID=29760 RepID=A0A438JRF9_VITVI|nr:hypothetical protein CK203_015937 [Vitis vinifera]
MLVNTIGGLAESINSLCIRRGRLGECTIRAEVTGSNLGSVTRGEIVGRSEGWPHPSTPLVFAVGAWLEGARVFWKFNKMVENQNGCKIQVLRVSERKNNYIMEMTRCMLHDKELLKKFWVEVASTVVFLHNKLPTKALKDKNPFEAWSSMINLTRSQNQTSSWDTVPSLKPTRCINLKQGS